MEVSGTAIVSLNLKADRRKILRRRLSRNLALITISLFKVLPFSTDFFTNCNCRCA